MVWDRMCECPDVFNMGNYWYIIYSEGYRASWSRKVKYMMATTFEGLKACFNDPGANWPKDGREGVLDSRAFYAGKTASNGTDRYIWGWCPFRTGATIHEKNVNVGAGGEPNWSGALVCHKLIQHEDGTLSVGDIPAIEAKYNKQQTVAVKDVHGGSFNGTEGSLSGDDAYVLFNRLDAHNHISLTVTTSNNWDKFGVSLVRGTDSEQYYTMVVNPENENTRKVNFEQEGKRGKGFIEGIDGYNFPRPADNVYRIDIYTDNSVMVMYINHTYAYTNRIYGIQKNCWSINNYGGNIKVSDLKVSQY
jgi:beta-fructofuranosidase